MVCTRCRIALLLAYCWGLWRDGVWREAVWRGYGLELHREEQTAEEFVSQQYHASLIDHRQYYLVQPSEEATKILAGVYVVEGCPWAITI